MMMNVNNELVLGGNNSERREYEDYYQQERSQIAQDYIEEIFEKRKSIEEANAYNYGYNQGYNEDYNQEYNDDYNNYD